MKKKKVIINVLMDLLILISCFVGIEYILGKENCREHINEEINFLFNLEK